MTKKALRFDAGDNVASRARGHVRRRPRAHKRRGRRDRDKGGPAPGHKLALRRIARGETVFKYGHPIGTAACDIEAGSYAHTHNISDPISNWKENYLYEFDPGQLRELDDSLLLSPQPRLFGYRRRNGLVGFRNHLVVLSTAVCANKIVSDIEYKFRDVVAITNPSGCVILPNEVERIKAIMLGIARNPNVGGVIFAGLGCESVDAEWFYNEVKDEKPCAFVRSQDYGSTEAAYAALEALVARHETRAGGPGARGGRGLGHLPRRQVRGLRLDNCGSLKSGDRRRFGHNRQKRRRLPAGRDGRLVRRRGRADAAIPQQADGRQGHFPALGDVRQGQNDGPEH